jgi:Kef-type K+ transport system membrane component KefB
MDIILNLGIVILIGIVAAKTLKLLRFPRVLTYVVVGTLLGESISGFIHPDLKRIEDLVAVVSLAFIAFLIGDIFKWETVKRVGTKAIWVSLLESSLTAVTVTAGIIFLAKLGIIHVQHSTATALLLGACAAATAPAATFMVVREYKANGPLTNYLLMAVTFDDAVGIILFDIAISIVRVLLKGGHVGLLSALINPSKDIFLSLIIGASMGFVLSKTEKYFKLKDQRMMVAFTFVLITAGLSRQFELSPLLSSMALGATFVNFGGNVENTFNSVETWTSPLLLFFFILAGSDLNVRLLPKIGVIGIVYVILRSFGKIIGSGTGAFVAGAPKKVQKYLGFAMLPQAGVAIGFAMLINTMFPELSFIPTTVLSSVVIFETIGPIGAKFAIFGAKEAKLTDEEQAKNPPS